MLKKSQVIIFLFLVHTQAWAASSAAELYKSCESYNKVQEVPVNSLLNVYNAGTCAGFIAGVWFTNQASCAPEGTKTNDAIRVFQEFLKSHPEYTEDPAADIVLLSQWKKWPCKKEVKPPQSK